MGSVIDYTEGTSFLHKANPVAKLVFALELFVAAFAAQGTIEVLAVLALTICVGVVSQNAQKTFKLVFGTTVDTIDTTVPLLVRALVEKSE